MDYDTIASLSNKELLAFVFGFILGITTKLVSLTFWTLLKAIKKAKKRRKKRIKKAQIREAEIQKERYRKLASDYYERMPTDELLEIIGKDLEEQNTKDSNKDKMNNSN